MARDKALHVGGHRSSSVSNTLAGMATLRLHTLRSYDIVSGKNASRSGVYGHIQVRTGFQTASKAGFLEFSCHTDRVFLSRTGISGTPRPLDGNCEQLGDDRMFSIACIESCMAVA